MRVARKSWKKALAKALVLVMALAGAVVIGAPAQASTFKSIQVMGFSTGSSNLNSTIRFRITNFVKKNPQLTQINCIGFDDATGTGESALGKARAIEVCSHASATSSNLTIASSRGMFDQTKSGSRMSRVIVVLSSSKAPVFSTVFNSNTGSKSKASFKSAVGEEITLRTPTREGFQFQGWFTKKKGGKLVGLAGEKFVPRKNSTLWARWVSAAAPTFGGGGGGASTAPGVFEIASLIDSSKDLSAWAGLDVYAYESGYWNIQGERVDQYYDSYHGTSDPEPYSSLSFSNFSSPSCGAFEYDEVSGLTWNGDALIGEYGYEYGESWSATLEANEMTASPVLGPVDLEATSPSIFLYDNASNAFSLAKASLPRVTGVSASDASLDYCWHVQTYTYLDYGTGQSPIFVNQYWLSLWTNTDDFDPDTLIQQYPNSPSGMVKDLTFRVTTSTGTFTIGLFGFRYPPF